MSDTNENTNQTTTITAAMLSGMGLPELLALIPTYAADPAVLVLLTAAITAKSAQPKTTGQKVRVQVSRKDGIVKVGVTGPAQPGASGGIGIWLDVHNLAALRSIFTGKELWTTVDSILAESKEQRQAAQIIADAKRSKAAAAKLAKGAKADDAADESNETVAGF